MDLPELAEDGVDAPSNLTETAESSPAVPVALTDLAEDGPDGPTNLTRPAESNPAVPTVLTDLNESSPAGPVTLADLNESTPALPTNLPEVTEDGPDAPSNLTELAEDGVDAPSNLTETAESSPAGPLNLVEAGMLEPAAPLDLTEIASVLPNRTGGDVVNLDFVGQNYNVDFEYSRSSSASYIGRVINQYGQYEYPLLTDYVGDVTNLIKYSEDFNQSDWVKNVGAVERDGDAFRIISNSTSITYLGQIVSSQPQSTYISSCELKAGSLDWVLLAVTSSGSNNGYYVNLKTGRAADTNGSPESVSIEYIGDDWYRVNVSTKTASLGDVQIRIYPAADNATLNQVGYILARKAQLTQSAKPLPYVKTIDSAATKTFAASPRIEYDPATGECLGYLAEGGSTNFSIHSENIAAGTNVGCTVASNEILAVDGTKTADKLNEVSGFGGHRYNASPILYTQGREYTCSAYLKMDERRYAQIAMGSNAMGSSIRANIDLLEGKIVLAVGEASIEDMGNGWFRCSITGVAEQTINDWAATISIIVDPLSLIRPSYTGVAGNGIYIWGVQNEELPFMSSYIRTESSAVSRASDALAISQSFIPNIGEQVSCFAEASTKTQIATSKIRRVFRTQGSVGFFNVQLNGGLLQAVYGVTVTQIATTQDIIKSDKKFISGFTFKGGKLSAYFNNELNIQPENSLFAPDFSDNIGVGTDASGGNGLFGHIKNFTLYNYALTADEVKTL
jgi:hypothetical protein